jgi:hypothetical protein
MVAIPKFYKSCRRVLVGLRSKTSLAYPRTCRTILCRQGGRLILQSPEADPLRLADVKDDRNWIPGAKSWKSPKC